MSNRAIESRVTVKLTGVCKSFGTVTALKQTSLEIRKGELMTLLGPSGCGKTTLLNIIAGFFFADEGVLKIDDERMSDVPPFQREIGMMFQNYALFPHMTVEANVGYGLKMRNLPKAEITQRVKESLSLVKLAGLEARRPRQLSGGQQQRVALARALVIRPKLLLLDEPFSALDKNLRASMQIELKDIQRKLGLTTIFVTHDQSEALSLSDRIAVMSNGEIQQVGTPEQIYSSPENRFVASFIGDVNVIPARIESLHEDYVCVAAGEAQVRVPRGHLGTVTTGSAVDLFVRPEQLRLARDGDAAVLSGTVHAQIYQGSYIDILIDASEAESGPIRVRLDAQTAQGRWPAGVPLKLGLAVNSVIAFPKSAS
jgi:spermidine/putrescine ABC transporter ATP-binding subunit